MDDHTKNTPEQCRVEESNAGEQLGINTEGDLNDTVPHGLEKRRKRATATRRQIAANRANGARSRGPRTLEGKEIAARNAFRHGLASRSVLLPGDDPTEYRAFADKMKMCWTPQGQQEKELVQLMIDAMWARRRIEQIEAGALRYLMNEKIDPTVVADLLNRILESLSRYAAAKERILFRAMSVLERLQDRRRDALNLSTAEKMLAAEDANRTVAELVEERAGEARLAQTRIASTKADPARSGESASPLGNHAGMGKPTRS